MSKTYLILDSNYLAHRAKHVFGELSYAGSSTGVVYGFLQNILTFMHKFGTDRVIFCWDSRVKKRRELLPTYKDNRKKRQKMSAKEKAFEDAFNMQVRMLQHRYLPTIGFRNVFAQRGYEADDIIAAITQAMPKKHRGIIISADTDLYQLIRENIEFYNPQKKLGLTYGSFQKLIKMEPKDWIKVKCIAGCRSDNVPGIVGVGNITAAAYIQKTLKKETKAYANIKAGWKDIVLRNRPLVELPFKGTITPKIQRDEITQAGWNKVTKKLGMKSIRYKGIV